MRGLAWVGCVLLLAACTRDNGAFDGAGNGGSAGEDSTSRTDGADGPVPSTGSGVDGTSTGERSSTSGSTSEATTMPLEGTTTETASAEGHTSTGATTEAPGTTTMGDPPPDSCCDPFMPCENNLVSGCACAADAECCNPGWGLYCVAVAMSQECVAGCFLPPQGCCDSFGVPGCNDAGIMACVCAQSPSCCTVAWEGDCASLAVECPESPCL